MNDERSRGTSFLVKRDDVVSTGTKIAIARAATAALRLAGFSRDQCVSRRGVNFTLDLDEGIDLSLL